MRRIALIALLVLSAACGTRPADDAARPGELAAEDLSADERAAFVYAAAIRHIVENLPDEPRVIYVLDRAAVDGTAAGEPIPRGVQDRVREELAALARIRFVGEPVEDAQARGGVFIALGPVPPNPDRVEVEAKVDGPRSEKQETLVLEREDLRWHVRDVRGDAA